MFSPTGFAIVTIAYLTTALFYFYTMKLMSDRCKKAESRLNLYETGGGLVDGKKSIFVEQLPTTEIDPDAKYCIVKEIKPLTVELDEFIYDGGWKIYGHTRITKYEKSEPKSGKDLKNIVDKI